MDQLIYVVTYFVLGNILILTAVIGNCFVIAYFGFREKRNSSYSAFILVLAISDLCGTICSFVLLVQFGLGGASISVPVICIVLRPAVEICLGVSSFLVMGMSYERYRGLTKPMNSKKTKRKLVFVYFGLVCTGWILYSVPLYIVSTSYGIRCGVVVTQRLLYYSATVVLVKSIIPFMLMSYFYFQIKKTLDAQLRSLGNSAIIERNTAVLRTLKILIIFFGIFVCVPSIVPVINYKMRLLSREKKFWTYLLNACAIGLPLINNAVNCFVYAGYVKKFRKFLLQKCFCRTRIERKEPVSITISTDN